MSKEASIIDKLGHSKMLVVGDVMLDTYTWTHADRISPEAPVMILRAEREEVRLGGAASVASMLRALEAEVTLAGVTGGDAAGRVVRKLLADERISQSSVVVDDARPTTTKERFMSRSANRQAQQIFRVDREERSPIDPNVERRLIDAILPQLPSHAAVLISDYAKGACTPALLAKVIEAARQRAIPVLIDPARIDDYAHYRHATLLAPNRVEAEMVTGRKIRSSNDALIAAESLSKRWEVPVVVIKLDCDGMVVAANGSPGRYCPTKHRVVQDVTGAGDMVLAMIGLAHASGLGWDEALVLANEAAGLEVERLGVSPVSKTELKTAIVPGAPAQPKQVTNDEMTHLVRTYRGQGKKIVFTNGCFDLLHVGHVGYLQEAASLGDVLIVAVNSDVSVRRLKGDGRPVVKELDRAAMIASLGCVDHVLIFDEDTPHRLLSQLRPDVLVKGGTYKCADVIGREVVESYGGDVKVLRLVQGISTTKIIDEIKIHQATSA